MIKLFLPWKRVLPVFYICGFLIIVVFSGLKFRENDSRGQSNKRGQSEIPVPVVILDADMDSDVDDIGALALALNLHRKNKINLKGVIITSDDPYAPVCAGAVNTFHGFAEIPVGFLAYPPSLINHSRYTRTVANEFTSGMNSWHDAEEGVRLYRKILSDSPEESVVIVTVGHLTSLMGLLRSQPDDISPLSGPELVREKVNKWVCMGGHFPSGKEANLYRPDPYSTIYCIDKWEKEIIFYGWELGNLVVTGGDRLKNKLNPNHPVYRAYELYNDFAGRASWDQLALLEFTEYSEEFFNYTRGRIIIYPDGSNSWENDDNGHHCYAVLDRSADVDKISELIDKMMAGSE